MGKARAAAVVPLTPQAAFDLWTDVSRWPTFVDGFGHHERLDSGWPDPGAKVVWRSIPGHRGTVTERVVTSEPAQRFATTVFEEKLDGTQTATFAPAEDGEGAKVVLELDYNVSVGGPLRALVDVLFIRRAQTDALVRTLRRFRTEAAEEAAL